MNKKLERLGEDLKEISINTWARIDDFAISDIRSLLKDLPPETTVQEIINALEDYT